MTVYSRVLGQGRRKRPHPSSQQPPSLHIYSSDGSRSFVRFVAVVAVVAVVAIVADVSVITIITVMSLVTIVSSHL